MIWYGVIAVLLYSVILPAKSCFSLGSGVCSLSYGGRLRFGRDVSALGDHLLFGEGGRKRIFIFEQPLGVRSRRWGYHHFPGSGGRGIVWTHNGHCPGFQSEQGICPSTEDGPCMDSKIPCRGETPPSYSQEAPLHFSDVTPSTVTVTWPAWDETTDIGLGPIETYIIEYREANGGNFQGIRKGLELSHQFQGLTENTEYEFRVVVVRDHPEGEGPPSGIQKQRTPSQDIVDHDRRLAKTSDYDDNETGFSSTVGLYYFGNAPHGKMPVRNLTVTRGDVGELSLAWSPPDLEPTLYITVGYKVRYVLEKHIACESNAYQVLANEIEVNDTEIVLTGLQDYAVYRISVIPTVEGIRRPYFIGYQGETASIVERTLANGPVANLEPVKAFRSFPTSLKFSWNPVTCDNQNGRGFNYSCALYLIVDGEPPKLITQVNVTHDAHVFTNLTSCGKYRLDVAPQNEVEFGNIETVEASTSSAAFGTVNGFSFNPTPNQESFTVEWQPPSDTLCPVASYTLTTTLQRQQACPECVVLEAKSIPGIQETSCLLDELLPYATYIVSITPHGTDVEMTGTTSEHVVITPKRAPSSSPNVMFDGEHSTQTSLTFTWDPVSCKDLNGIFIQYTYSLKETDSEIVVEEDRISDLSQNRVTFTGLVTCTNYTFSIRVETDAYKGLFSTIHGATAISAPGNDTNLRLAPEESEACNDGATCLTATWRKPLSNACPIEYQKISLHQLDNDNCGDPSEVIVSFNNISNTQFHQLFTSLEPNSLYRATLVVGNAAGSIVTKQELRTLETAPSAAPQFLQILRPVRGTRVNVTWEAPACGHRHGDIIGYKYELRLDGKVIRSRYTSASNMQSLANLQRNTQYSFNISAVTDKGPGPYWTTADEDDPFFIRTRP